MPVVSCERYGHLYNNDVAKSCPQCRPSFNVHLKRPRRQSEALDYRHETIQSQRSSVNSFREQQKVNWERKTGKQIDERR